MSINCIYLSFIFAAVTRIMHFLSKLTLLWVIAWDWRWRCGNISRIYFLVSVFYFFFLIFILLCISVFSFSGKAFCHKRSAMVCEWRKCLFVWYIHCYWIFLFVCGLTWFKSRYNNHPDIQKMAKGAVVLRLFIMIEGLLMMAYTEFTSMWHWCRG